MNNKLPLIVILLALAGLLGCVFWFKQNGVKSLDDFQVWLKQENKHAQPEPWVPAPPDTKPDKMPKIEDEGKTPLEQGKWYDYATAMDLGKRHRKHVFIHFSAEWCTWCKKMQKETYTDSQVKTKLNNYVLCVVDTDKQRDIATKYNVSGIPTYVITHPDGNMVKTGSGFKPPNEFLIWANAAAVLEID